MCMWEGEVTIVITAPLPLSLRRATSRSICVPNMVMVPRVDPWSKSLVTFIFEVVLRESLINRILLN